ncbi:hypothetical protein [Romboutsia sp.]|uniref:hypothetical protein n=1 Tax=Romboutsia sp. TaxID=1965302 RepID=UPI003F3EAB4D
MSRRENIETRNFKMRKFSFISKILFILTMTANLILCAYIIDRNAKIMLGETSGGLNINSVKVQAILNEKIKEINEISVNIIKQFNK